MVNKMKCLEPFNLDNAKIVILGAFPGEISVYTKKYYSDLNEQFWQLLGIDATDYETCLNALKAQGIGLWDVVASCKRGAGNRLKSVKYNKMSVLNGKKILFNGKTAYNHFLIATEKKKIDFNISEKDILPSSVASFPIKSEKKQQQWNEIINNARI